MRVLHALGWYFPDNTGGTEVYVQGLAHTLMRRGHDVVVAAPRAGSHAIERYEDGNLRVVRYPIPARPTRDEVQGRTAVRGAQSFPEILKAFGPDIVHVHSLVTGLGLREMQAARDAGARVVYTNHLPSMGFACPRGTLMRWGTTVCDGFQTVQTCTACALNARGLPQWAATAVAAAPFPITRAASRLPGRWATTLGMTAFVADGRTQQHSLTTLADRIVVLNDAARQIFVMHGADPRQVVVNRLGVSAQGLSRKPDSDLRPTTLPIRVGFVGRLDPLKGVRQLAHAILLTPRALPMVFEFRGPADGEASRELRAEVIQLLKDDPRVSFGAAVMPSEVGALLSAIDVLACPSTWFENGPTVALEAAAVGTPVIASALGAPCEFIRDRINGRLIPPGNVDALVEAFRLIAADPAGTIDAWRRHLPLTRWMSDIASDYERLYEDVLSMRRADTAAAQPV
jgi:glycosyltransferase involved in cell wall biosynthesis